ncbi:MAG: dCTP deaminase [Thermoanaerobaculia bacterium]|jgi:dCTP deaminase|nr:dCTP deaminase [Thermoanaerobaculia bacterium]
MILSNVGIQAAIDAADLVITPEPTPRRSVENRRSCPYDTCSVNLRLGSEISITKPGKPITLDFRRPNAATFLPEIFDTITIDQGGYALAPNRFTLAKTLERVHLPIREGRPSFAARIEGRSTFARVGLLVHFTAPTIHAGFEGTITLEMINLGEYPISLFPGMEICQLIIEEVDPMPFANPSVFHAQSTPTGR